MKKLTFLFSISLWLMINLSSRNFVEMQLMKQLQMNEPDVGVIKHQIDKDANVNFILEDSVITPLFLTVLMQKVKVEKLLWIMQKIHRSSNYFWKQINNAK